LPTLLTGHANQIIQEIETRELRQLPGRETVPGFGSDAPARFKIGALFFAGRPLWAPARGDGNRPLLLALMFIVIRGLGSAMPLSLHAKFPDAANSIVVYNEPH
jgi:hypothetical protein